MPKEVTEYLKNPESLVLSGSSGIGKTHIAIGIYKILEWRGYNCKIIPAIEMFYRLRDKVKEDIDSEVKYFCSS